MVIIIFYSSLTSVSNSRFIKNLNDEEMITSHLMCVMKQLSYDKNIMFEREKQQQKNLGETCYINLGYYKV